MRYLYLTIFVLAMMPAFSQTSAQLTAEDKREIKAEAKKVIENHLSDLLNSIASDEIGVQGRKLIMYNSFLSSENQIFETSAIIEDDTSPEYTISRKGYPDLKVQAYLEKLDLIYTKGKENSIQISEVNVTDVVQGTEYSYVLVHYKTQFMNKHRNKPELKYAPVIRTAELKAEKPEKQWKVLMTGIRYYKETGKEPAISKNTTNNDAKQPVVKQVSETKQNPVQATAQKTKEIGTAKTTVAKSEPPAKKQEPVSTAQAEVKKAEPEVVKAAEKSPELVPSNSAKTNTATVQPGAAQPNAALKQLETQMAKYKKQTNLFRAGAGVAVVGAAATFFVVNSAYSDYKSTLDKSNAELETWWNTTENGKNFGSVEDYKAKPKSLIEFGSPGIYFVGAGVVAGGVLWFLGSGSNKKVKEYRKQLEQKTRQLSITPQLSGQQRYAGIHIRYQF